MMYQCWEVVTISASRKRKVKFALSQFLCKESNKKGKKKRGRKERVSIHDRSSSAKKSAATLVQQQPL